MKTYSLFPLVGLTMTIGMFLGGGLALALMSMSIFSIGGGFVLAAVILSVVVDRMYRGCRVVENKA